MTTEPPVTPDPDAPVVEPPGADPQPLPDDTETETGSDDLRG